MQKKYLQLFAKRFKVPLSHVVSGKRIKKTESELYRNTHTKMRGESIKMSKQIEKFLKKLAVPGGNTTGVYWWNSNDGIYYGLTPKVVAEGVKLRRDLNAFYRKFDTSKRTLSNNWLVEKYGDNFSRFKRPESDPVYDFLVTLNAFGLRRFRNTYER